jgi:hypothetical protein
MWAAYAACVLALLHAAASFYWAGGGTAGLSTIGGALEQLGRAREPALIAVVWAVGLLKALAGLLALALVRPWGRAFPRRVLLTTAWGGAGLLIAYGSLFTLGGMLVVTGVNRPPGPPIGRRSVGTRSFGTRGSWCGGSCSARLRGTARARLDRDLKRELRRPLCPARSGAW